MIRATVLRRIPVVIALVLLPVRVPLSAADDNGKFIAATGTLQPLETVEISTRVSGPVVEINVELNATVKGGEVLAKLDTRPYAIRLERAQATQRKAQAGLEVAKAKLALAEAEYARHERLAAANAVDRVTLDGTRQSLDTAKAAIAAEESNYLLARCDVQAAQLELEDCVIRAPRDGIVIDRRCTPGSFVGGPLAAVLFVVASDFANLQLVANVAERDIGQVQAGQAVQFTVPAYPGATYTGRVRQLSFQPKPDGQTPGTFRVVIDVPNTNRKLFPYMTAAVKILTQADR